VRRPSLRLVGESWPAVLSIAFVLPVIPIVRHPDVGWFFLAVMGLLALAAHIAPGFGLLLLAVLVPLALALEMTIVPAFRVVTITESLLFAFLAGAAWRQGRPFRPQVDRLGGPALVLAAIVLAGMAVDVARPFAADPATAWWRHLVATYFVDPRPPAAVVLGWRWLGALALAVFAERILRRDPAMAVPVVRFWLIGGAVAGSFAILRLADVMLSGRVDQDPWASLVYLWRHVRFSTTQPDLNAAGSYFAVFLVAGGVLGVLYRRVWLLLLTGPPVLVAFAFARSRAAFVGVAIVLTTVLVMTLVQRRRRAWAVAVGALIPALLAVAVMSSQAHVSSQVAWTVRIELLRVGMAVVREHLLFGVGLGGFPAASQSHITEELPTLFASYQSGENAHNNFVQLAAELGVPALVAFLCMIAALWKRRPRDAPPGPAPGERVAVAAGVAAFLISALAGQAQSSKLKAQGSSRMFTPPDGCWSRTPGS
jgi:O-antigen ligase